MLAKPTSESAGATAPKAPQRHLAAVPKLYQYQVVPPFSCDRDGYPEEDSAPVEGFPHSEALHYAHPVVKARCGERAFVGGNGAIYYEEGNPRACIVPDLFVVLDAGGEVPEGAYKLWRSPVPDFVLEAMSPRSWRDDLGIKKDTYLHLGVREYWVFDSRGAPAKRGRRRLAPPLAGFRLAGGAYEPVLPDGSGRLLSQVLGLELRLHEWNLQFYEVETGERLLSYPEERDERLKEQTRRLAAEASAKALEANLEEESAARRAAEARIAALEAQLHLRRDA